MTPKRPNESGESPCIARWIVETPAGWLGAWDVEAFDAYAAARMEAAPTIGYSNGTTMMPPEVFEAWKAQRATPEEAALWRPVTWKA